jgi:two-component system response regulator VanR
VRWQYSGAEHFKAMYGGEELTLTLKEFEILMLFVQNKDKTLSHDTILSRVWGYDFDGGESTVHTHIKNLRAKLPENIIKTIRGVGYRLELSNEKSSVF